LTGLAGVHAPEGLDGVDLSACLRRGEPAPDRPIVCDALLPRWGPGTEFRSIRRGRYKYVRFRNAPPLAFDLENDPGEQTNLLESGADLPEPVRSLATLADESIDFDEAEREYRERDGSLTDDYRLPVGVGADPGNVYVMPSGSLVDAGDTLYRPTVVADSLEAACGAAWRSQNTGPGPANAG
jgi:hypothetical protein